MPFVAGAFVPLAVGANGVFSGILGTADMVIAIIALINKEEQGGNGGAKETSTQSVGL